MIENGAEAILICSRTNTYRLSKEHRMRSLDLADLGEFIKRKADEASSSQSRICLHEGDGDAVQMMMIYHAIDHPARLHVHNTKTEYIQLIEGAMTLKFYGDDGRISKMVKMGDNRSNQMNPSICVVPDGVVHSVHIDEDCIFMETSAGPFGPNSTEFI